MFNDSNVILNSRWCFNRNELVITFPNSRTACEYQRINPEARIFGNSREYSDKDVYLPHPQGLSSLRGSSQGEHFSLVLEFASEREARAWDEKVLIGSILGERSKVHVYINKKFTMGSVSLYACVDLLNVVMRLTPMTGAWIGQEHTK